MAARTSIEWVYPPRAWTSWDGIALAAGSAVVGARILAGAPALLALVPRCAFLHLTGFPCATCGFTRAFVRVSTFELGGALSVSPLGTFLFVACAIAAAWVALARVLPGRVRLPRLRATSRTVRFGIVLAFLANWVYAIAVTLGTGAPPP